MGLLRRAVPLSRAGLALWGWRHRHEIGGWAGYVVRSAPRLVAGDTADVLLEGRVRARLTADDRTRDVKGLDVAVEDGVVTLSGQLPRQTADAAVEVAATTSGVRKVRDQLKRPGRFARR